MSFIFADLPLPVCYQSGAKAVGPACSHFKSLIERTEVYVPQPSTRSKPYRYRRRVETAAPQYGAMVDESHYQAQVAALPVTGKPGSYSVLLVNSSETRRWIIPKGWPMKGRKDYKAAAQEALEEAGLEGHIHKHPIGAYTYEKRTSPWCRADPCHGLYAGSRTREPQMAGARRAPARIVLESDAAKRVEEPGLTDIIRWLARRDADRRDQSLVFSTMVSLLHQAS